MILNLTRLFTVVRPCVEEADIDRYKLAYHHGGVYHDADVDFVVPPIQWPERFPQLPWSKASLVVGVEFPDTGQVCTWAFAAAPGCSVLKTAFKTGKRNRLNPGMRDVVSSTGPEMFTNVLRYHLGSAYNPDTVEAAGGAAYQSQKNADEYIIVLPYRAFGIHPAHRHRVQLSPESQVLVRHGFRGSWRADEARRRCS